MLGCKVYHYDLAQQSVMVKADTQIQKYMSRENLILMEMPALVFDGSLMAHS